MYRNRWAISGAVLVAVAAAIAALVLFLPSGSSTVPTSELYSPSPSGTAQPTATPTHRSVLSTDPTPAPTAPVFIAPVVRLRIPAIDVDAPVRPKGIDATNTMENPDGPEDVAWYTFTAKPGLGAGNAVFSGHVDYINYGKAVFGDVAKLKEGDAIEVVLDDGTVVQFSVTASTSYHVDEIPMDEVLAPTSTESITLITCTGQFSGGAYSHRLVVRGVRTGLVPGS